MQSTTTCGSCPCFLPLSETEIDAASRRAKLQHADRMVEEFRKQIDLGEPENYGFASVAAIAYAHIVANMLRGKYPKGVMITLAPNPKDIVSLSFARSHAVAN